MDARIRGRLYRGRAAWALRAVLYYVLFVGLAPFAIQVQPGYGRVIEGVAFAVLATVVTWLVVRRRSR